MSDNMRLAIVVARVVAVFCIGCGVLGVCVHHIDGLRSDYRRQAACTRVLECTDLGADREECDALFPACARIEGDP
jgi:hypothetical protein